MTNHSRYWFFSMFLLFSMQLSAAGPLDLEKVKAAAEQGDRLAQSQLAATYYIGLVPSANRTQAASLFRKAAAQGDLDSMVMLAAMTDAGLGVPRSLSGGKAWYQKAADLGHEPSKGVLSYYSDTERAVKGMSIAAQYAKKILKKIPKKQ